MEEVIVTKSGIKQLLIPDAKEDPLAGPLQRLLSSPYSLVTRLDFPGRLCTERWTRRVETLSKGRMKENHALFKPLVSLLEEMRELWGKWEGTECERADLLVVIAHYDQYIKEVCAATGKERIKRLVGPARLYGYGWKKVWQVSQKKARHLAGIDVYNQPVANLVNERREIKIQGDNKCDVLLKLLPTRTLQADREYVVGDLAHLLFGNCLSEKLVIKLRDIWVADVSAEVSRGTDERRNLTKYRDGTTLSVDEVFNKHPWLKKKYKFWERGVGSVAMACEVPSIQDLEHHISIGYCLKRMDSKSLSTQFCLSLLIRPSRDRLSNLLVSNGKVTAKEYLESLEPPVLMRRGEPILSLRSMLLMHYADRPLDDEVCSILADIQPEEIILDWLHLIAQRNANCKRLTTIGIFSQNENQELGLPIKMPYEYVSLTYYALRKLKDACNGKAPITLGQLFKAVHPEVAAFYERLSQKSSDYHDQQALLFPKDYCYPSTTLSKSEPLYKRLQKIAVPQPAKEDHKTPLELAERWLRKVSLENFNDKQGCAIVAKALKLMPNWHELRLRHCPLSYEDLVSTLNRFPQIKTLSFQTFHKTVTKQALLNLSTDYPDIDISIGECSHISAVNLRDLARSKGKFSIRLGTDIYQLGNDPNELLRAALKVGATTVAEYCVLEKAELHKPNKHNKTLLHQAAKHWPLKSLKFLVDRIKDVDPRNYQGATPFLQACKRGDVEVINLLKAHGASLEATDIEGLTGLHHAVIAGRPEAVKLLLDWGVSLDDLSDKGFNSLHLAVLQNKMDIMKIFAKHGGQRVRKQCNQGDANEGATPLHLALRESKRSDIVRLLVSLDCGLNICDNTGSAPFHWAAEHRRAESFIILLEAGANLRATDKAGRTALDLALQKGHYSLLGEVIRFNKLDDDHPTVVHLVQKLLEKQKTGNVKAGELFVLGLCYEFGKGSLDKNMKTARKCHKDADQMGSPLAQYHLAKLLEKQDEPQKAFNMFKRAADQGHTDAQYHVGLYLWEGIGRDYPNMPEAIEWFQKAAKSGHPEANFQLYNIYREGRGVKKDLWKAAEHLQAAADAGHVKAKDIVEYEQSNM